MSLNDPANNFLKNINTKSEQFAVKTDGSVVTIVKIDTHPWEKYVFGDEIDDKAVLTHWEEEQARNTRAREDEEGNGNIVQNRGDIVHDTVSKIDFDNTRKIEPLIPSSMSFDLADDSQFPFSLDVFLEDQQFNPNDYDSSYLPIQVHCKHIGTCKVLDGDFDCAKLISEQHCSSCGTEMEVWLCLVCLLQFCGRYQNSHMLEHHSDSGHCIIINLTDLSVWCYGCDMYLQHEEFPFISQFFSRLHYLKHKETPRNSKFGDLSMRNKNSKKRENGFPMKCAEIDFATDVYSRVNDIAQGCAACAANNVPLDAISNAYREDWMCLTCGGVYCGRYHNKHGLHHFQITSHPLALSFVDLSIWCYQCMEYIDHNRSPNLIGAVNHVTKLKDALLSAQR